MTTRVNIEPAYVLHRRAYSNTSWLVDFFTLDHGRVTAVARSARGLKSRYRGKLELFYPMLVSWSGRNELKSLGNVEFSAMPMQLEGNMLLCGFYLNELLTRLLHKEDPHPKLFRYYSATLQRLQDQAQLEVTLRCFEKHLLHELGYGLTLDRELQSKNLIESNRFYQYIVDRGFIHAEDNAYEAAIFSGESLLALHHESFPSKKTLGDAKRLMRLAMSYHLGGRPLKSRDLL